MRAHYGRRTPSADGSHLAEQWRALSCTITCMGSQTIEDAADAFPGHFAVDEAENGGATGPPSIIISTGACHWSRNLLSRLQHRRRSLDGHPARAAPYLEQWH